MRGRVREIGMIGAFLMWGCASVTALPSSEPEQEGVIVEVGQQILDLNRTDQVTQVLVTEETESERGVVWIATALTEIRVEEPDGSIANGDISDLTVGARVRVWADGIVQLSAPGIGTAAWVVVLR